MSTFRPLLLVLLSALALPWSASAQPPQFTVELLAAPPGGGVAHDINDVGMVVGHVFVGGPHAALWNGKKMTDFGAAVPSGASGPSGRATGINRSGVGFFNSGGNGYVFDARSPGGGLRIINNAALAAINDRGELAGSSDGVATLWSGTIVRQLASGSAGLGLNNFSVVTGSVDLGHPVAIRWRSDGDVDAIELLTPPADPASVGYAIDDFSNVAGIRSVDGVDMAVAWSVTQASILGQLPHTGGSRAWDININQWIVGESLGTTGGLRATLWVDGVAYDLSSLVTGNNPFATLRTAFGLNDRGEIVGAGEVDGIVRPFVLHPKKGNRTK
jgi:hypothetical protein